MTKVKQFIRNKQREAKDPNNNRSPIWKPLIWIMPAIIILCMFSFYPIINSFQTSFQDSNQAANVGGANYSAFFNGSIHTEYFTQAISNSVIYSVISVPIGLMVSILIAFLISKVINKATRGFLQTLFFLPYVTSALAISFTFAFMFDADKGLINSILNLMGIQPVTWLENRGTALVAMIVFGIWRTMPFQILIITLSFIGTSKRTEAAARIDGAGPFKRFFRVSLPAISPTLVYLVTIGIIGSLKVFPIGLFPDAAGASAISDAKAWTLVYLAYHYFQGGEKNLASSLSIIILVFVIAMMFFTRYARKMLDFNKPVKDKIFWVIKRKPYVRRERK